MSMAFGSGKQYSGQDLAKAHEHMIREQGLGLPHFDAVAGHLVASMRQLGVEEGLVNEAAAIVMSTRHIFDPANYGITGSSAEAGGVAAAAPEPAAAATVADPPAESALAAAEAAPAQESLYKRIGGAGAVQATVEVFYKRVLGDPLLAPFFQGVDMGRQKAKQVGAWRLGCAGSYVRYYRIDRLGFPLYLID